MRNQALLGNEPHAPRTLTRAYCEGPEPSRPGRYTTESSAPKVSPKRQKGEVLPTPKHWHKVATKQPLTLTLTLTLTLIGWHKVPTKQPITLRTSCVYRGGKKDQSRKGEHDEGQPDSGADLFQSLISVVNLFRGKSRMQIDMLLQDFIKAARMEGRPRSCT